MQEIRLAKLAERAPVKIVLSLAPDLHRQLADYAEFYAETYGEEAPAGDLIAAILEAFLSADRAFGRRQRSKKKEEQS